jgi:hypothetical protein
MLKPFTTSECYSVPSFSFSFNYESNSLNLTEKQASYILFHFVQQVLVFPSFITQWIYTLLRLPSFHTYTPAPGVINAKPGENTKGDIRHN